MDIYIIYIDTHTYLKSLVLEFLNIQVKLAPTSFYGQ